MPNSFDNTRSQVPPWERFWYEAAYQIVLLKFSLADLILFFVSFGRIFLGVLGIWRGGSNAGRNPLVPTLAHQRPSINCTRT